MKAIIVGDNLITSEMIRARCSPLYGAGCDLEFYDWLAADRNDLGRRNLNVEVHGPDAEAPSLADGGHLGQGESPDSRSEDDR